MLFWPNYVVFWKLFNNKNENSTYSTGKNSTNNKEEKNADL